MIFVSLGLKTATLNSTIEDIRRLRTSHILKQNSLHQNDIRAIGAENSNIAFNNRGYKKPTPEVPIAVN
jgi:hypothetical protein